MTAMPTPATRPASCSASSIASMARPAKPTPRSPITASPASFSTDDRDDRAKEQSMSSIHLPAERRRGIGPGAVRLLAALGCATMLAGCYTNQQVASPAASDYRLRHPIAIKEGPHTVELFIG